MKKIISLATLALIISAPIASKADNDGWTLVWEENFDTDGYINPDVWSKIPRGKVDWNNTMSDNDALFDVRDGNLILRGMVNPDPENDPVPYITGGIYTKDKQPFGYGKIEVRALLDNAQGAWPAIWMLPFDGTMWPNGGEIDIMERLNSDSIAYQTVHSHYTYDLGIEKNPPQGATGPINNGEYNVYSVEIHPDSIVFAINGNHTLTYPRIETDKEGQFPFNRDYYLLLDMQIEGNWVGKANPDDYPAEMKIDWVRFYKQD